MKKKISILLGGILVLILAAEIVMIGRMKNEHRAGSEEKTEETSVVTEIETETEAETEVEAEEKTETEEEIEEAAGESAQTDEAASEDAAQTEPETVSEENGMLFKPEMDKTVLRPGLKKLKTALNETLRDAEGDWAVYVRDLSGTTYMQISEGAAPDNGFIRLYIMGTILESIESEDLEETEEVDTLLSGMIAQDSYECANKLVEMMDPVDHTFEEGSLAVWDYCLEYDLDESSLNTELEKPVVKDPNLTETPTPTPEAEEPAEEEEIIRNLSSAADAARFLELVYTGENVSGQASQIMEELLLKQTREGSMSALDEKAVCGWICDQSEDSLSEGMIVYADEGNYILTVTAAGLTDLEKAEETLQAIALEVYAEFCPRRAAAVKKELEEKVLDEAESAAAVQPAA